MPAAKRAAHTYWAVVNNPGGAGNATLARASDAGITATEGGGAVAVIFPVNVSGCANVAARNNAGTTVPGAGYAQTNVAPANPNAIEVRTRDEKGADAGRRLPPDRRLPVAIPAGAAPRHQRGRAAREQ